MRTDVLERQREHGRIQQALVRFHSPRLQMALIVCLTGVVGFFASVLLLHANVDAMWVRYPLSVGFAYGAFLLFLWCWLHVRDLDICDGVDLPGSSSGPANTTCSAPHDAFTPGGGNFGGGGASGTYGDGPPIAPDGSVESADTSLGVSDAVGGLDLGEIAAVLVAIVAIVGAAWAAVGIISEAPSLFADVLLDAALARGLYRRLRGVQGDHWIQTAVRRTLWRFATVAVLFSLAGAAMHLYAPEAKSIGHVLVH
jgi:hypothetical protein